jgi:uncharacterized protein involved in exopolysaccharide biosynthesis
MQHEILDDAARPISTNEAHATSEIDLLDLLLVFTKNLRLLILGPLLVGAIALGVSFLIPPTFTATTTFLPPQQQSSALTMLQSLGGVGAIAGAAAGLKNPTDQYVSFLSSQTVEYALVERFNLLERYKEKYRQDARRELAKKVKIAAGKDGIISVEFDDKDPAFAADVANAYVEELGILISRMSLTEAQQRRLFFEKQLSAAKDNLIKAEQSLAASGVSVSTLNVNPSTALEGPARLRAQVTAQEVKMAAMRSYLTTSAPEYRREQAELSALRSQLTAAEKEQPSGANGTNDYIAKYREFKYQETLFELFSRQFEVAKLDESRDGALVQVIDKAIPPELKSKPKKAFIAIAATLLAGIALLIWVYGRFALNNDSYSDRTSAKLGALKRSLHRS